MTTRAAKTSDAALTQTITREVAKRVVGQEVMVERLLIGLLTGGHILLEGVPGLAKTMTIKTVGNGEVRMFGVALESGARGVEYDSLGVNGALWKAFAFGLGAAIAGLAGVFYPGFVGTLVPDAFGIIESFTMMAMVIVGGMGTMIGPVIGAIVLTFLPELLRGFGESRLMIYGLALTLVVLFMPGGIVQAWLALRSRFS